MRIAVLGNAGSWYLEDLRRAASRNQQIHSASYQQLVATVEGAELGFRSGEVNLSCCDAVLVRSMPPGSLEQIVFRMDALANLAAAGVQVVNPPRAIEAAVDKYLATTRLHQAGLLVPRTVACQSVATAMEAFVNLGGDVVVKPLFGSEGRGIMRVSDEAIALRTFRALEQIQSVMYLQEFIEHEGCDYRLLVVGEQVLGMRRSHPTDWRTNISRGATAESLVVSDELSEIAHRASRSVGAVVAGVDLLPGRDGRLYAIEVNAVPGWRALARVTGVDVAQLVLGTLSRL